MSAWSKSVNDPIPANNKISFGQIIAHLRKHDQIKGPARSFPRELHNLKLNLWLVRATYLGASLCDGRYVDRQQAVTPVGQHSSEHANGSANLKSLAIAL